MYPKHTIPSRVLKIVKSSLLTLSFVSFSTYAVTYNVTVAQNGSGDYKSIQEAIQHAPKDNSIFTIYIKNGTYHEKLEIDRANLYLIGEDRDQTIITASTANGTLKSDGSKWGTTGSRTVNVNAANFKARSLTIANGFDYPANQRKDAADPSRVSPQAVALLISDKGQHAQFKDVKLDSYQDTLYIKSSMNYFEDTQILGHVDFIFGYGGALFENAQIITRDRPDLSPKTLAEFPYGYITAPATNINQKYGLVFKNCRIEKESANIPAKSFALGRPWHPTTTFDDGRYADPNAIGHAAFIDCYMDDHIYGWDKMDGKDINGDKIWFYPEDSRFWEYKNTGPGASLTEKAQHRPQLDATQIKAYTNKAILDGWQPDISLSENSQIQGEVLHPQMSFPAAVEIKDSLGKSVKVKTDKNGHYQADISGMTTPLLVSVDDQSGQSCLKSDQKRSLCMAALITNTHPGAVTLGNINPFTDVIVSGVALSIGLDGPQLLASQEKLPAIPQQSIEQSRQHFTQAFQSVFKNAGINQVVSPESYPERSHDVMQNLTQQVLHNRGYNTQTGLASATSLTDLAFQPILSITPNPLTGEFTPSYTVTQSVLAQTQERIKQAKTRIFLVGDSTVSNYEKELEPRMGWGQALSLTYSHDDLAIINAARSGRSSRDYINGRWLDMLQPYIKKGDYLFIEFSHNDEKCDASKGERGPIDVANLCTYPNSANGNAQFPKTKPEMSFAYSLERYIHFAQNHGMHPIMFTATARAKFKSDETGEFITSQQHITKQNDKNGYLYVGNYTQTVIDTAIKNKVPLIDMQQILLDLVNQENLNWRDIWLVVDPTKYPYYKDKTGSLNKPDTTHFQENGAKKLTEQFISKIKLRGELDPLDKILAQ